MLGSIAIEVRRGGTWRWWGPPTFALGWLVTVAAVASPLDSLGESGSLSAHVAQHVALSDLAAPLLLIGLPPATQALLRRSYERLVAPSARWRGVSELALSPMGATVLWALATYVWLVPVLHRSAIADGPVHLLDHLSFLAFGLLVWLAAFDFRTGPPVRDWETLRRALTTCDLPWWARHVYAMGTRLAMLPAVAALWLMSTSAYYLPGQRPPGDMSRHDDQVQAASLMLGFEILLSGLAIVLAFIWVAVSEGRARQRAGR